MLQRLLDVSSSEGISKVETDYTGGMDFTARIYLEGEAETLRSIIDRGRFSQVDEPSDQFDRLDFKAAPKLASISVLYYEKHEGTVDEYIAITADGTRLWYGAFDY